MQTLAALTAGSEKLTLWEASSQTTQVLDTGLKAPTFMAWSKTGPHLVIGGNKGSVMMYNRHSRRKANILGKHSSTITCGAWNKEGTLALGSSDKTFSLSNSEGDFLTDPV